MNTTRVSFIGGPCSGKTTLAQQVNFQLKMMGFPSAFVEEYAVDYIADCGPPKSFEHQKVIFEEQFKKERKFNGLKAYIISDSASWTCYIYGRALTNLKLSQYDVISINQMHRKILENIDYWDYIFYLPSMKDYKLDGIRYQDKDDAEKMGEKLKYWMEIENVPYYDLSSIPLEQRVDHVISIIVKKGD